MPSSLPWTLLALLLATPLCGQVRTHGDLVGSVTPDSVIIWTRASVPARASVRYSTQPSMAGARETPWIFAGAASDNTAKVKLSGLLPATHYYYRTKLADPGHPSRFSLGPVGTFKTAPMPGAFEPVTFLFSADVRNQAQFGIFSKMAAEKADFFVLLGDFPYADGAVSIADYRGKHKAIRNNPLWWAFSGRMPVIGIWDDHEVTNNWDATTAKTLVRNGRAVWLEYFPVPAGTNEIYRTLHWGRALDVFLLDERSHRGVNAAPDLPGKTLLGDLQMAWVQRELQRSTALFKVVATGVPLRYSRPSRDAWDGYMFARRRLLDFIVEKRIANVVFITADQHFAASHLLREGLHEFQAGPLAQAIGRVRANPDPEVTFSASERNYGLIRIDPRGSAPTLTVEWRGMNGLIRREVVTAGAPARVTVQSDVPEGAFHLSRPGTGFRNSGRRATLPLVPPGDYRLDFRDVVTTDGQPTSLRLSIPPGADVHVAADYEDVPGTGGQVLLAEDFDEKLSGFTVVDDTTTQGPSSWFTDNGYLYQSSNIKGPVNGTQYLGTTAVKGSTQWRDYTLTTRLRSHDDDAIGVVFRYTDRSDYYRFSFDSQRSYRRLVSVKNGRYRTLAENRVGYEKHQWYDFRAILKGDHIVVQLDGQTLFDLRDRDHAAGAVGYYAWSNHLAEFDELIVRRAAKSAPTRPLFFHDDFADGRLLGWTIIDQGRVTAPSRWIEAGGVLKETSNINDGSGGNNSIPKLGTMAVAGPVAADFDLRVRLRDGDNDAIGVVFRYVDANNYYRFSVDHQRSYRRLAKVVAGRWSTLWEDHEAFRIGSWHTVEVRAVGSGLAVAFDDRILTKVTDGSHPRGRIGLYSWSSKDSTFDDVQMLQPAKARPVLASIRSGRVTRLQGLAPRSHGRPYLLALSTGKSPGIPLFLLQPGDRRRLELNPDALFLASFTPNSFLFGFQGRLDARGGLQAAIAWPALPALRGSKLFCGGFVLDPRTFSIGELLPTVETIFP